MALSFGVVAFLAATPNLFRYALLWEIDRLGAAAGAGEVLRFVHARKPP